MKGDGNEGRHAAGTGKRKTANRFVDTRESVYGMMEEVLVVCPRCQSCARISPRKTPERMPPSRARFPARRVVCTACAFTRGWSGGGLALEGDADPMRDGYFDLLLWLQAPCCGHTLWAYNARHLDLIDAYVRADLREQHKDPKWGWSNQSLANRLPEWMIVAKHREAVLKAVAKLKARLVTLP